MSAPDDAADVYAMLSAMLTMMPRDYLPLPDYYATIFRAICFTAIIFHFIFAFDFHFADFIFIIPPLAFSFFIIRLLF